jgi:hypothetical protein
MGGFRWGVSAGLGLPHLNSGQGSEDRTLLLSLVAKEAKEKKKRKKGKKEKGKRNRKNKESKPKDLFVRDFLWKKEERTIIIEFAIASREPLGGLAEL